MMSAEIAGVLTECLNVHLSEVTFRLELEGWSGEHILQLVEQIDESAREKDYEVAGVRVGADIFASIGASAGLENARMHKNIPIVAVPEFNRVEVVLRKS